MIDKKTILFILITIIYIFSGMYIGELIIAYSNKYKSDKEIYTQKINYENRMLNKEEWISGDLNVTWRNRDIIDLSPSDNKPKFKSNNFYINSYKYGDYFLIITVSYFLLIFLFYLKKINFLKFITLTVIITAVMSFYVGLFSPMIEISAFKKDMLIDFNIKKFNFHKTFPGEMYFYYQSKSIVELVVLLLKSSNIVVGISILLFSIILPLFKLSVSFMLIINNNLYKNKLLYFTINKIGKWSMADVFVVAVYLAFLSFNNLDAGVTTKSNILVGLYFFLTYCILSLISSHLITKLIKKDF